MWCSVVGLFMGRGAWSWIVPDSLREIARPLIPEDRVRPQGGGTQRHPKPSGVALPSAAGPQNVNVTTHGTRTALVAWATCQRPPLNPRRSIQLNRP